MARTHKSLHRNPLTALIFLAIVVIACSSPTSEAGSGDRADTGFPAGPSVAGDLEAIDQDQAGSDERPVGPDGYLVWASAVEPAHLHYEELPATITAQIRQGLLEGLFGIDSSITYYPELLATEPEVSKNNRNQVTIGYRLREGLRWSDGEPLTANDVAYTFNIIAEGCRTEADGSILDGDRSGCVLNAQSRLGYDRITELSVASDTVFTVSMSGFFPGWRDLFSQVFAAHAYGETASEVNDRLQTFTGPDGPLPTSGPLTVEDWERGQRMLLAANENYHGSNSPDSAGQEPTISGVQISFYPSEQAAADAVRTGEADLTSMAMEPDLVELAASPGLATTAWLGPRFEHLAMNLLNAHLASAKVRNAVAVALDKKAIVAEIYDPIIPGLLPEQGLGNTYWVTNQPFYEDHQAGLATGDVEKAKALLESDGYVADDDGILVHPDRGQLRLGVAAASNDDLRVAQLELIAKQLEAAGFTIETDTPSGAEFFTDVVFSESALDASASGGTRGDKGLWDLALFGWSSGAWPGGQSGAYRAGSRFNPYGFTAPSFDAKANECDAEPDDEKRADCYNELDRIVTTLDDEGTQGLFVIPISQRPPVWVHNQDRLSDLGPIPSTTDGGPLVNLGAYKLGPAGAPEGDDG